MPTTDVLAFLALIVGLCAYIATIRLRLIDKITSTADAARKRDLKNHSRALTLADAPLVISGSLLFLYGFWEKTFGILVSDPKPPEWLLTVAIWVFTVAAIDLAVLRAAAWWKSIRA